MRDGEGEINFADGKMKYTGKWKEDEYDDQGMYE
jgi:hypothetical protein